MDLFLIVFIGTVFVLSIRKMNKNAELANMLPTVVPVRRCPPHKWKHHEVKDTDGKTVMWKLVCDHCGPIKPMELGDRKAP
jgi:hypothetical protein